MQTILHRTIFKTLAWVIYSDLHTVIANNLSQFGGSQQEAVFNTRRNKINTLSYDDINNISIKVKAGTLMRHASLYKLGKLLVFIT